MTHAIHGKKILVIGGTGSLGKYLVKYLIDSDAEFVRVLSRDEDKQHRMKQELDCPNSNIEYMLGDVRDRHKVRFALDDIDIVVNTAALKHVPTCEREPHEAFLTNVVGVNNVKEEAIYQNIPTVISIGTDKSVMPVNVLGYSKALGEKIHLARTPIKSDTRFISIRYGNILGSRGSVLHMFRNDIEKRRPLKITSDEMTRFILPLSSAAETIIYAIENGLDGEIWVRKSPSVNIATFGQQLAELMGETLPYPSEHVGIRAGEKLHEDLISTDELRRAVDVSEKYVKIAADRNCDESQTSFPERYSSNRVSSIDGNDLKNLLVSCLNDSGSEDN